MNRDSGFIMPFVLGVGVGAIAALLLAPKAGEDLRSDIVDSVNEGAGQIGMSGRKLKQRLGKVVAEAQEQMHETIAAGQSAYNEAKNT
jgi:gas vesicle protein